MAPKNAPPAAKQAKILSWFQTTMGVYTFKELEKLLPSVGSINGMQVKDYLTALTDENLIRCEKIGSGNWYWCFTADARKGKERVLHKLIGEEEGLKREIGEVVAEVQRVTEERGREEVGVDRETLVGELERLEREKEGLDGEMGAWCEGDPGEVLKVVEETKVLMDAAALWTDNLESIYGFVCKHDRDAAANLMVEACGDDYVLGEGLKELLGP